MDMRFRQLGAVLVFCLAAAAQTQPLTIDELMKFLSSSVELKMTDTEVAKFLGKAKLSEKLDDVAIEKLQAGGVGPKTLNALRVLRDQSESLGTAKPVPPPPKVELPPVPNAEEQAAIIEEVREYALNYSKSLPNFLSTQVVRRYQAGAPGSRYNTHSEPSWVQVDLLTLRLSYFDQKEEYKLIMHNNSPTTQDYKSIGGATSTGEFGSLLRDIFEPRTHARFWWDGWARLGRLGDRQLVMAFGYSVEQANSNWGIEYEKKDHIVPAYSGRILIDRENHMVHARHAERRQHPGDVPGEDGDHRARLRLRRYQRPSVPAAAEIGDADERGQHPVEERYGIPAVSQVLRGSRYYVRHHARPAARGSRPAEDGRLQGSKERERSDLQEVDRAVPQ